MYGYLGGGLLLLLVGGRQCLFGFFRFFRRHERNLGIFGARDDAGQTVVIFGGNGIELVVVAAGTRDRQAEKAAAQRVDAVVVLIESFRIAIINRAEGEEAECRRRFPADPAESSKSPAICSMMKRS